MAHRELWVGPTAGSAAAFAQAASTANRSAANRRAGGQPPCPEPRSSPEVSEVDAHCSSVRLRRPADEQDSGLAVKDGQGQVQDGDQDAPGDPGDLGDDLGGLEEVWASDGVDEEPDWPEDAWDGEWLRGDPAALPAGAKLRVVGEDEMAARRTDALKVSILYRIFRSGAA